MKYLLVAAIAIACAPPVAATQAQTAQEILGPPAVVPLTVEQPPARIIVDPPLPGPLSEGKVFIQYRVVNLRIEPVFGPKALAVSPRIGHIHVTVDGAPWHWADASGDLLSSSVCLLGLIPSRSFSPTPIISRSIGPKPHSLFPKWRHPRAATDCVWSTSPGTTR
jgi:Family of unknown function (DUF6130)